MVLEPVTETGLLAKKLMVRDISVRTQGKGQDAIIAHLDENHIEDIHGGRALQKFTVFCKLGRKD